MIKYKILMLLKNISMSLSIHPSHAYFLLGGLYLGKFTNFFSDVIITGLILYIVTPTIFSDDKIERAKNWCWSWFDKKPVTINISQFTDQLTDEQLKLLDNSKNYLQPQNMYQNINPNINPTNHLPDFSKLPKIEIIASPKPNQYGRK